MTEFNDGKFKDDESRMNTATPIYKPGDDQPVIARKNQHAGRWKLFAVIAVCAAPVIASYLTYYVIKPSGRTNYGDFIESALHSVPSDLATTSLDGKPMPLKDLEGKWIMLQVDSGNCTEACRTKLYEMRQLRLTQGRERDRIERVG